MIALKRSLVLGLVGLALLGCEASSTRPELPEASIPASAATEVREAMTRLYAQSPHARAKAATRLGAMGERALPAAPYLASLLRDASKVEGSVSANPFFETPDQVAFHAGLALAALGKPGRTLLMTAAKDGNDNAKRAAVYALGEAQVRAAVPLLVELLRSRQTPVVRENVPLALQKIGDLSAVPALIEAFERRDGGRTVWSASGAALAALEDARAIEPALRVLKDPSEALRRHLAAQLLGRIKDWPGVTDAQLQQAIEGLIAAGREEGEVAIEADKALAKLRGKVAPPDAGAP